MSLVSVPSAGVSRAPSGYAFTDSGYSYDVVMEDGFKILTEDSNNLAQE